MNYIAGESRQEILEVRNEFKITKEIKIICGEVNLTEMSLNAFRSLSPKRFKIANLEGCPER